MLANVSTLFTNGFWFVCLLVCVSFLEYGLINRILDIISRIVLEMTSCDGTYLIVSLNTLGRFAQPGPTFPQRSPQRTRCI